MKHFIITFLFATFYIASYSSTFYKSIGYGNIVSVDDSNLTMYDYTSVSLLKLMEGKLDGGKITFHSEFGEVNYNLIKLDDDSLIVLSDGKKYYFKKINELPNYKYNNESTDPISCFEIFWNTFNENCLVFDIAGVDWKKSYDEYRPQIDSTTTDSALYDIFYKMLKPLNDGHTTLANRIINRSDLCGNIEKAITWVFKAEDAQNAIENYFIEKSYRSKSKYIVASHISNKTAYLGVHSFAGYSTFYDLSEIESFKIELDSAVNLISDAENIVVDLRFNQGGLDQLSFELVSRFAKEKQLGYYRQAKIDAENNFSSPEAFQLIPGKPSLNDKKVVVLVSPGTISAADVCAMLFKNLEGVTLVGETTYGIFSDMLVKFLPRGFVVSLSNEKYTDINHQYYEQKGIDPDIEVKMDWENLALSKDNVLDSVLQLLNPTSISQESFANIDLTFMKVNKEPYMKIKSDKPGLCNLTIHDLNGRLVINKNFYLDGNENLISLKEYLKPNKLYLSKITQEQRIRSLKFIF